MSTSYILPEPISLADLAADIEMVNGDMATDGEPDVLSMGEDEKGSKYVDHHSGDEHIGRAWLALDDSGGQVIGYDRYGASSLDYINDILGGISEEDEEYWEDD